MSGPKRYNIECTTETTTKATESVGGQWVRFEDYQALEDSYSKVKCVLGDMEEDYARILGKLDGLRDDGEMMRLAEQVVQLQKQVDDLLLVTLNEARTNASALLKSVLHGVFSDGKSGDVVEKTVEELADEVEDQARRK